MSVAPALDLSALPVAQRVAALALIEEVTALREITRRQEHLIAELNHALHGKRSEKLSEDERQLAFEELSIALAEVEAEKDARGSRADDAAPRPAPKRTIGNLPTALPRIEVVIEPENLDCPCGCGPLHRIGEDRTERLDIVPAQLRVIVTIRPRYACRGCTDGVTQAKFRHGHTALSLAKHSHDLRFRETALSHSNLLSSRYEKILLMQPLNHGEDYR
ncbi:Transposase C of IS166 homeodomain-containing protein [Rhodobacter sp. 24-YEA-8]|nr:Transposase C of IS166 homeodomain-containing protein [Rhodobacter sp. 24-YEA-8]